MLTAHFQTKIFAARCDTCGAKRGELGADRDGAEKSLHEAGWRDVVRPATAREIALWTCPNCVGKA